MNKVFRETINYFYDCFVTRSEYTICLLISFICSSFFLLFHVFYFFLFFDGFVLLYFAFEFGMMVQKLSLETVHVRNAVRYNFFVFNFLFKLLFLDILLNSIILVNFLFTCFH